jgi:hypothetical protein
MAKSAHKQGAASQVMLSYADFLRLCHVDDPNDWQPYLRVAQDGVWLVEPPQTPLMDAELRADLSEHPDGDPSKPVITFPVSLGDIEERIINMYGGGFIDPMELADFVALKVRSDAGISAPLGRQRERNYLRVVNALVRLSELSPRSAVSDVCSKLEGLGFSSPKRDTVRDILQAAREEEAD